MLGATSLEASGIGDIWSTGAFSFESPLKDLLDSNNYTMEQLLDEDELLQELRGCHETLQTFFGTNRAVTQLIQFVTRPRPDQTNSSVRYPYMACEIICCEIDPILDALMEGTATLHDQEGQDSVAPVQQMSILDLLFTVLDEDNLDDYRAGYLDKILMVLFRKKGLAMMEYINSHSELLPKLLNHLYSHSIMQIAQRLLLPRHAMPPPPPPTPEGDEIMSGDDDEEDEPLVCDWIHNPQVLPLLLTYIQERNETERTLDLSLNASEVLITIIQNSFLNSDIILEITKVDNLRTIMDAATLLPEGAAFSRHESLLTSAMNVLESLILQLGGFGAVVTLPEATADGEPPPLDEPFLPDLTNLVTILPELLERLSGLLQHDSTKDWNTPTQFSESEPMLGSSRLRIVRVLESLVLLGDSQVDSKLVQSDCLILCLDYFWNFQWCSMLHQSVANLLVHVIDGQNARYEMQEFFVNKCNLLGRLMDSFDIVENIEGVHTGSDSEKNWGSSDTPLPVSEDDVDAALETPEMNQSSAAEDEDVELESSTELRSTEAVRFESRAGSTVGDTEPQLPSQTFRYGYMGHVLIICQALVHAYTNDPADGEECVEGTESVEVQMEEKTEDVEAQVVAATARVSPSSEEGGVEDTAPLSVEEADQDIPRDDFGEPLLLFELLYSHPLAEKWNDFVDSTLDAEIAVQSAQLGGYDMQQGFDQMQRPGMERPGLADDDYMLGDDGSTPPVPPVRGMLGGGDVIDMDDNDLDVAASMMIGLSLGRPSAPDVEDDGSGSSGNSERSYNSGETASERSPYAFDDPLGKAGGLGIELGKLTQYDPGDEKMNGEIEGDDSSHSSSDEEPEQRSSDEDVPVMDLFAGNFNVDESGAETTPDTFTDFADFESATPDENDDDFGPFAEAPSSEQAENKPSIDDIFGEGDHAELLELDDEDELADPFAEPDGEIAAILEIEQAVEPDSDTALVEAADAVIDTMESSDADAPEVVEFSDGQEKIVADDSGDIVKVDVTPDDEIRESPQQLADLVEIDEEEPAGSEVVTAPSDELADDGKDAATPLRPENGGRSS